MKIAFFLFATLIIACIVNAQNFTLHIKADGIKRENTPVEFPLPSTRAAGNYLIKNVKTGKSAAAQITNENTIVFILKDELPADFSVHKARANAGKNPVKVVTDKNRVSVSVNNKQLLYYHTGTAMPPVDSPAYYARSGFIHPLYSPSGNILTDDFPAGHAHQHGIMMAWVSTKFRNEDPDFWNQQNTRGNVKHIKLLNVEEGSVLTRIKMQLQHYTETSGEILSETWTISVYPFSNYFLFDIKSSQFNTTSDTLYMKKYHYGGMEFRGSREWNADDKIHFTNKWKMLTDSGFTIENGNGRKAAYVSVEGNIGGKHTGVAVFSFPDNFRYPQPIRIHPEMPYWCFAPMVDSGFTIAPRQRFDSRYRYFVFDGARNDEELKRINNDILHPVEVSYTEMMY